MYEDNNKLVEKNTDSSLIAKIYGVDFKKWFPYKFIARYGEEQKCFVMDIGDLSQMNKFIDNRNKYLAQFTNENMEMSFSKEKMIYYKEVIDHFIIKQGNEIIGYFSGNIDEINTYYLRYVNIIKPFRGYNISFLVTKYFLNVLDRYQEINKIKLHTIPTNNLQFQKMLCHGFKVSGQILSENHGAMIEYIRKKNVLN